MQLREHIELKKFMAEKIKLGIEKETPITDEQAALMTACNSKFYTEPKDWKHWLSFRKSKEAGSEAWDVETINHNRLMRALLYGIHFYNKHLDAQEGREMILDPGFTAKLLADTKEAFNTYCSEIKDWSDKNIIEMVSFIVSGASEDCCNFVKKELLEL